MWSGVERGVHSLSQKYTAYVTYVSDL